MFTPCLIAESTSRSGLYCTPMSDKLLDQDTMLPYIYMKCTPQNTSLCQK